MKKETIIRLQYNIESDSARIEFDGAAEYILDCIGLLLHAATEQLGITYEEGIDYGLEQVGERAEIT